MVVLIHGEQPSAVSRRLTVPQVRRTRGAMLRVAHLGTKGLPAKGGTERVVEAVGMRHAVNHDVTVYGSRLVCRTGVYCGMRIEALPTSPGKRLGPVLLDLAAATHCLVRRRST